MKCPVCGHASEVHDQGGTHCKTCGETTCRAESRNDEPTNVAAVRGSKEEDMNGQQFDTNKSLAVRGAMRGQATYGSVPAAMLNTASKCDCGAGEDAAESSHKNWCGMMHAEDCKCSKCMVKNAKEYQCSQHCNQTFNTAASAHEHAEKYDCTVELVVKNSVFRFTDSAGEVIDVEAVEEMNAWEALAGKFNVPVDQLKGHGLKIERVNKGDDYSTLSDKQLKELEEHYENALQDHRKLGDAETANELHECLMNIKAERKKRGR